MHGPVKAGHSTCLSELKSMLPPLGVCIKVCWSHGRTSQVSLCSGIIDMHVHMTGGGGEAGPASRCPEAQVKQTFTFLQ